LRTYVVKTLFGLEEVLAEEIRQLGGIDVQVENRAVSVRGDLGFGYKLNYQCRTALSVLAPVVSGRVRNEQHLYDLIRQVQWHEFFSLEKTFIIDVVCYSDFFRNSHFLAQKCKDAIVDQFRDKFGRRPSVSKEGDVGINVFIKGEDCVVSLDTSGASLFKRGYRKETGPAPINEVLAAGLISLSGWDRKIPLVDPMCGSGTIVLEAAMLALGIPPQFRRQDFAFIHLLDFDEKRWQQIKEEARPRPRDVAPVIIGRDINRHFLNLAKANAAGIGMEHILWEKGDFFNYRPQAKTGMLLFNPPYDARMPVRDAIDFYTRIGDHLKKHFSGWQAWIISSHLQAIKHVGLKPSRKIPLYNGPLECRFVQFEMYEGSRN
jgi:putative N6-adenine-specific DNA methylase